MPTQGKGTRLDTSEMMMRLALPYIVFFLMFICAKNVANAAGDHWCYKDPHCGAKEWRGECQTGKQQSPIDFNDKNTKENANSVRLRFNTKYMDTQDHFFVKNNGHTIQLQLQEDNLSSDLLFDGDFIHGKFRFSQLHFHWGSHEDRGSEHTVNGNGYVAELHLVHYRDDYKSLGEAVGRQDRRGLAVLGIFFQISNQDNAALQPILDAVDKVRSVSDLKEVNNARLNISALLPDNLSLWRYYGSLTTPSCNEVVMWTVFKTPVPISRNQWQKLLSLSDTDGHKLEDNYRPVQTTANRKIWFLSSVSRTRMPEPGETERNKPVEDTFFADAQKAITSKQGSSDDKSKNNGANSPHGGLVNSAITGFVLLSVFIQVMFASALKCI